MGGRGAASGTSNAGYRYASEYKTLIQLDNIKVLQKNWGAAVLPQETMSAGKQRVYAIGNKSGELKSIGFYAADGRLKRQIDADHAHDRQKPHVHEGFFHSRDSYPMTKSDWAYYRKVLRVWNSM